MNGFTSVLWQEFILFKRKFKTITLSAMVSPILYLIAFGWGMGSNVVVEGKSYINFIIPGIIALTTMTTSYNNTANSVNISRIFYKTFEAYMMAPITTFAYAMGKIVSGALTGLYSALLIVILSLIFKTGLTINGYSVFIVILNCLLFAAIGFTVGVFINSHTEMSKFSSFVITPMSFLCGTFFSISKMPGVLKTIVWCLPLTHTSLALRNPGSTAMDFIVHPIILILYFLIIVFVGIKRCKKAE